MGRRGLLGILLAVVLIAGVAGIAYNMGVARGVAESGQISPPTGTAPYPYPYYGPYWHHGPFGFGFFGFLFPLLFIFLIFGLLRGLFWHSWRGHGYCGRGVPPMFEEWHRRAHEEKRETGTV